MNTCYNTKMVQYIAWLLQEQERPEDWDDLYSEYIGLRENKSSRYIVGLIKEIGAIKAKFKIVNTCCEILLVCFQSILVAKAQEIRDILRQYNYRFKYDLADEKLFSRDIRATMSANKKCISLWERKEKELDEYQKKHEGKAWAKKDFYIWAITLGEFQGYRVDLETIYVAEWCQMINRYEQYCEVKNAEQRGKHYGKR